jgi:hypothetical protein
MNNIKTYLQRISKKSETKNALTWGGSSLRKDANLPPHQSHAVNRLPLSHKPF